MRLINLAKKDFFIHIFVFSDFFFTPFNYQICLRFFKHYLPFHIFEFYCSTVVSILPIVAELWRLPAFRHVRTVRDLRLSWPNCSRSIRRPVPRRWLRQTRSGLDNLHKISGVKYCDLRVFFRIRIREGNVSTTNNGWSALTFENFQCFFFGPGDVFLPPGARSSWIPVLDKKVTCLDLKEALVKKRGFKLNFPNMYYHD